MEDRRSSTGLASVTSLRTRGSQRWQAARRREVRAALEEARLWIVAGLEGACPLEEAVAGADQALWPAVREALKASLL